MDEYEIILTPDAVEDLWNLRNYITEHKKASPYGKEEPYRDACNYIAFIFQTEQTPRDH